MLCAFSRDPDQIGMAGKDGYGNDSLDMERLGSELQARIGKSSSVIDRFGQDGQAWQVFDRQVPFETGAKWPEGMGEGFEASKDWATSVFGRQVTVRQRASRTGKDELGRLGR